MHTGDRMDNGSVQTTNGAGAPWQLIIVAAALAAGLIRWLVFKLLEQHRQHAVWQHVNLVSFSAGRDINLHLNFQAVIKTAASAASRKAKMQDLRGPSCPPPSLC